MFGKKNEIWHTTFDKPSHPPQYTLDSPSSEVSVIFCFLICYDTDYFLSDVQKTRLVALQIKILSKSWT